MVSIRMKIAALFAAAAIVSCNDSSSFKSKVPSDTPTEEPIPSSSAVDEVNSGSETPATFDDLGSLTDKLSVSLKVDIVFAIDTSGSMDDELVATQNNLQKMIAPLNSGQLDPTIHLMLDAPIVVPAGTDPNKVAIVNVAVDSTDAISRLNGLFTGLYSANYFTIANAPMAAPLAFRKDAKLEVVVITDDNGVGAGNLAIDFDSAKKLKATFNGIIGLPTTVASDTCELSAIGNEYITLAMQSSGSTLDICSPDWSALITRLSNDMVKRSVTFPLSKKPLDAKAIQVTVDGKRLATADFSYDAQANTLTLVKTESVKDGSLVALNYNPAK